MQIVGQMVFTPKKRRNPRLAESAKKAVQRPLTVLDATLVGRDWLVGRTFSVADVNLAGALHMMKMIKFDYSAHSNVQRWADTCYARLALARAMAKP